jgi:crossover junction endodeoxyribonuclease RusA
MTRTEWLLDLPFTRPLSLNDRMHHMAKARKVREYRDAAHWVIKAAKVPACEKVRVTVIYRPRDNRRRDPLNLVATLKACEDGMVDAGVVPDDNPEYVESVMPLIDVADPQDPGLQLYIERVL